MDASRYLRHRFPIERTLLCDDSSSHVMWRNLGASSSIKWTQINGNDSHPRVSPEPLIEDEQTNPIATPNFAYKLTCYSMM